MPDTGWFQKWSSDYTSACLQVVQKQRVQDTLARHGKRRFESIVDPMGNQLDWIDTETMSREAAVLIDAFRSLNAANNLATSLTPEGELVCEDVSALPGTQYYRATMKAIASFRFKPSHYQMIFIRKTMHSLLPLLYDGRTADGRSRPGTASDWQKYKKQICEHLGYDGDGPALGCIFSTPRQFGKTTSQAMICASLMASVPGINIIQVSTGGRISKFFSALVISMLSELGESVVDRIITQRQEELTMRPPGISSNARSFAVSILRTLPSNPDTLRGLSGDVALIDEAGFTNKALVRDFILPLLKVMNRRLIAISTPSRKRNTFFSSMVATDRDTGMEVLVIEAMCKDCAAKRAETCPHRTSVETPWTSRENEDYLKNIYELVDRDAYNREIRGATVETEVPAFNPDQVKDVFDNPEKTFRFQEASNWRPPCVFMAIDPSGLGKNSEFAVMSFFYTPQGRMVIIGLDAIASTAGADQNVFNVLCAHKASIRKNRDFCHSQIVVIIEAQYDGYLVAQVWRYLREPHVSTGRPETIFMTSDYKGKAVIPGIVYHPNDKDRFVKTANDFFEEEMVMLYDKSKLITSDRKSEDIIQKLQTQLLGFLRFPIESTDPVAREDKVMWTGKPNGPDDLTMCLLFGIYWSSVFMFDPEWTRLVPSLPRSTTLTGAVHNAIVLKYAEDLHPEQIPLLSSSSSSSSSRSDPTMNALERMAYGAPDTKRSKPTVFF